MFADELGACVTLGKGGGKVEDWCLWDGGRSRASQSGGDRGAEEETGRCGCRDGKRELNKVVDPFDVLFFEALKPQIEVYGPCT